MGEVNNCQACQSAAMTATYMGLGAAGITWLVNRVYVQRSWSRWGLPLSVAVGGSSFLVSYQKVQSQQVHSDEQAPRGSRVDRLTLAEWEIRPSPPIEKACLRLLLHEPPISCENYEQRWFHAMVDPGEYLRWKIWSPSGAIQRRTEREMRRFAQHLPSYCERVADTVQRFHERLHTTLTEVDGPKPQTAGNELKATFLSWSTLVRELGPQETERRYNQLVEACQQLDPDAEYGETSQFYDAIIVGRIQARWEHIEQITDIHIPLVLLGQIVRGESELDQELLTDWLAAINRAFEEEKLIFGLFHRFLLDVIEHIQPDSTQQGLLLGNLYIALCEQGLAVANLPDPRCAGWVNSLRIGDQILGYRIVGAAVAGRYPLEGGQILRCAQTNRATFLQDIAGAHSMVEEDDLGIDWVGTRYIDPEGCFAIIDEAGDEVRDHNASEYADQVIAQLTPLVASEQMPEHFTIADVRLVGGHIRLLRRTLVPLNPVVFEQIVYSLAGYNFATFQRWMERLQLAACPQANDARSQLLAQESSAVSQELLAAWSQCNDAVRRVAEELNRRYKVQQWRDVETTVRAQVPRYLQESHVVVQAPAPHDFYQQLLNLVIRVHQLGSK